MRLVALFFVSFWLQACAVAPRAEVEPWRSHGRSSIAQDDYAPTRGEQVLKISFGSSLLTGDASFEIDPTAAQTDDSDAYTLDLGYGFFLTDRIEIGLQNVLSHNRSSSRFKSDLFPALNGSSETTGLRDTLGVTCNYNYPISTRSLIYIGPHAGLAYDELETVSKDSMGTTRSDASDSSFFWGFQLGFRQFLTPAVAYRIEWLNRSLEFEDDFEIEIWQRDLLLGLEFAL